MTEESRNNGKLPKGTKRGPRGEMNDSWMLDILDDPETDRMLSELMVEEAVGELGMAREDAERAFLPAPKPGAGGPGRVPTQTSSCLREAPRFREPEIDPEIALEDLYRMMSDIMTGKTRPHLDSQAGWKAWRALERDITEIKRRGGVVDFPAI